MSHIWSVCVRTPLLLLATLDLALAPCELRCLCPRRSSRGQPLGHIRNVPPTFSDIALISRMDDDFAPVAAFLQVAVGISHSL
jgi:hypothetical protein